MIKPRVISSTAWHAWQVLVVALSLVFPVGWARGQATDPTLSRLVRPTPGTRPLGAVLAELSRQGHLPMSYSSSFVPVAHPVHSAAGPARPLGVVLAELLAAEQLAFGLLNGQLVLWRAHSAVPAGVVAVNGGPVESIKPARLPVASPAAPVAAVPVTGAVGIAKIAAAASRPVGSSAATLRPRAPLSASPTKLTRGAVVLPEVPIAQGKSSTRRPSANVWAAAPATQRVTRLPSPSVAAILGSPSSTAKVTSTEEASLGKRVVAAPGTERAVASRPNTALPSPVALIRQARSTAAKPALAKSAVAGSTTRALGGVSSRRRAAAQLNPSLGLTDKAPEAANTAIAHARQQPSNSNRAPVGLLSSRPVMPTLMPEASTLTPVLLPSAVLKPALARSPAANPDNPAAAAKPPFVLASLLRPSYLHAEAWGSETLPFSAAGKVGIPRLYLTFGIAAGPLGRQSGGVAGGVGLGTAFQPRGRFTPSLDLMQWFLAGERQGPGSQLTQLRPLLAWQFKEGGRLRLIGGPTLNLATGRRDGGGGRPRAEGELGQGQWLWLNSGDDRSFRRLWPGVQLGLRF